MSEEVFQNRKHYISLSIIVSITQGVGKDWVWTDFGVQSGCYWNRQTQTSEIYPDF